MHLIKYKSCITAMGTELNLQECNLVRYVVSDRHKTVYILIQMKTAVL